MFSLHLIYTLDVLGTIIFAASGALIAYEQQQNGLSAVLYAVLTALGGGTIRDMLLSQQPVFWIQSPAYLFLASAVGLLTFMLATTPPLRLSSLWLADAASLAAFSIVGTQVMLRSPAFVPLSFLHWIMPPLMGMITSVGGGFTRDIISQSISPRVPFVMKHPHYALCALITGSIYCLLSILLAIVQASDTYAILGAMTISLLMFVFLPVGLGPADFKKQRAERLLP
ncbi:MAG: TRIC cation channel family protein [Cyanobacteria bacterium P01_A01_bin.116]